MILDTNALSALADGERALAPILLGAAEVALPVIVLGEFLYGIRQSKYRSRYETWLSSQLLPGCRLLHVDEETAHEYSELRHELKRVGRPIPANDTWIAALAHQHSLPVLSRDQHFDSLPHVKRIGW